MSQVHRLGAQALRLLDPETAHGLSIRLLSLGLEPRRRGPDDPILATDLAGLALPNPLGLAAGFDKNADVPGAMLNAGFGFVECGTVTPLPQEGNPRPRIFRLRTDEAVINRMGFPGEGLDVFARNLAKPRAAGVVGANIGANKESTDRIGDYVASLTRLWPLADYFTANVSSPNTPGLRALQGRAALDELLRRLTAVRAAQPGPAKPLFLKVAPDLSEPEILDICESVAAHGVDGVIVGNTTLSRPGSLRSHLKDQMGGLSGKPLLDLSTRVLRQFHAAAAGRFVLIGCGGVSSGADAYAKIRAGASAVQFYSALTFSSPALVEEIKASLAARLKADGFKSIAEAVGAK